MLEHLVFITVTNTTQRYSCLQYKTSDTYLRPIMDTHKDIFLRIRIIDKRVNKKE